ncbi:hypothetical protein Tco_0438765 [Tanacetum coccineum]
MAPKRATRSTPVTTTPAPTATTTTSVTNAQLQAMIDQGVTAALAARDANRNGDDSHTFSIYPPGIVVVKTPTLSPPGPATSLYCQSAEPLLARLSSPDTTHDPLSLTWVMYPWAPRDVSDPLKNIALKRLGANNVDEVHSKYERSLRKWVVGLKERSTGMARFKWCSESDNATPTVVVREAEPLNVSSPVMEAAALAEELSNSVSVIMLSSDILSKLQTSKMAHRYCKSWTTGTRTAESPLAGLSVRRNNSRYHPQRPSLSQQAFDRLLNPSSQSTAEPEIRGSKRRMCQVFLLPYKQPDWRDDTDDEPDDQELEAHYMYMAHIQEVTPDAVDNSGPIFDVEPLQKEETMVTILSLWYSLDMCYDREQDDLMMMMILLRERQGFALLLLIEKITKM